ncbi:MAG TPA: outer membrane beta-barrel protein [Candidatus Deferrimicrobiaceae bacterium]|nr:outer membrane beta-barrel protein [Candidatus Deferrimicrobiaceae bacterium]
MRKSTVLFLTGLLCVGLSQAAWAQRYERYERLPPPPRGAGAPPPHAVYGQTYLFGHIGIFEPNDDEVTSTGGGLEGYDTGGSFDIGIGSRVSPNLAIEGTFGAFAADRGSDEVAVVPLTIGARLILPAPVIEPYIGGGLGIYFASLDEPGIDDSDTTVGGYGALGLDAWLNPRTALNFEGKYHWVEPEFGNIDVDVSGWTLSLGIRVSF